MCVQEPISLRGLLKIWTRTTRVSINIITLVLDRISDSEHCYVFVVLLWPPYGIGQAIIFSSCRFFYLFPRLISAVADRMSTILVHMVWP